MTYLLAHDLGTTGNKATLFDAEGRLIASVLSEYGTFYPAEGAVEQNAGDWWRAVCDSSLRLMEKSGVPAGEVVAVSFSGQMMGCLPVDKDGEPLGNALIWADTRAKAQEQEMLRRVPLSRGYQITGHRLSASYSAAKLLWIRDHEPERFRRIHKMLNAKDYMLYRMTGRFVTDYSDASSTNLFDLRRKDWSDELLSAFELPRALMPEAVPSATVVGRLLPEAAQLMGLLPGTPVVAGGGDGSCACVGAGGVQPGDAYCVLGSSSWISTVAPEPLMDPDMRTFNWVHLDPNLYTPCGTMQAAGYSYQWFCKRLLGCSDYEEMNALAAQSPPGANGLLYLPYLLGERSPRWDLSVRGAFVGLGASTTLGDMARAVMEGVGFNLGVIYRILQGQLPMQKLTVIGGGAKADAWLHILAEQWRQPLTTVSAPREATSMGAAVCGGVGVGLFEDFSAVRRFCRETDTIVPSGENAAVYEQMAAAFETAYQGLRSAYAELEKVRAAIRR